MADFLTVELDDGSTLEIELEDEKQTGDLTGSVMEGFDPMTGFVDKPEPSAEASLPFFGPIDEISDRIIGDVTDVVAGEGAYLGGKKGKEVVDRFAKQLPQPFKFGAQAAGAAGGAILGGKTGEVASELITGSKVDRGVTDNLIDFGLGRAMDRFVPNSEPEIPEATRRALGLQERAGDLAGVTRKSADDIRARDLNYGTRSEPGVADKLEGLNAKLFDNPGGVDRAIVDELGGRSSQSAWDIATTQNFRQSLPELREMGAFDNARTVEDVIRNSAKELDNLGAQKDNILQTLTEAAPNYNVTGADFDSAVANATNALERIDKLSLNEMSSEMAEGIRNSLKSVRQDLASRSSATPEVLVNMYQNLNEVRRVLDLEFNSAKIAGEFKGDVAQNEAARAGVAKAQEALGSLIEKSTKEISDDIDPQWFSKWNQQYKAHKSAVGMVEKFMDETSAARTVRGQNRMIPTPGRGGSVASTVLSPTWEGRVDGALRAMSGRPDAANVRDSARSLSADLRERDAIQNIADLEFLDENVMRPGGIPVPQYGGAQQARDYTVGAAGRAPVFALSPTQGLEEAEAEEFPTDVPIELAGLAPGNPVAKNERIAGELPGAVLQAMPQVSGNLPMPFEGPEPFMNGLPRDTTQWGEDAVQHFLMETAEENITGEGPAYQANQVASGLISSLRGALKSGDKRKVQAVVADMAKLFPEHFEPGTGVDGKLFHPDEQQEYMEMLEHAMRNGVLRSSFLAQQRDAFLNKFDQKILDLPQGLNDTGSVFTPPTQR